MEINIRQESPEDYVEVEKLIEAAFKAEKFSDHREHFLVKKLRDSNSFVPELSIVAEIEGEVIGHVLLTKIKIKKENTTFESLALAPISVKPKYQKQGVGGKMIRIAHKKAISLGYKSIVVLGHEDYYPRFGYQITSKFGIKLHFEATEANCMIIELVENGLQDVSGIVEYPRVFFETE